MLAVALHLVVFQVQEFHLSNGLQAEVLQNWAEGLLAVCRSLPDAELTKDAEQQASSTAKTLFKQAVDSYQQVS